MTDANDVPLLNGQPCSRDKLLFSYLSLLHDLVTIREDIKRSLEEGFIQLAKSKSLLGSVSLEFDQLRTESCESAVSFDIAQADDDDSSSVMLSCGVDESQLRGALQRICMLPPSSLRSAQTCFRRSVQLTADLNNVYARLQEVAKSFQSHTCTCDHEFCQKLENENES